MKVFTDEKRFMVFNDTFKNILVISWQSVLLVGGKRGNLLYTA